MTSGNKNSILEINKIKKKVVLTKQYAFFIFPNSNNNDKRIYRNNKKNLGYNLCLAFSVLHLNSSIVFKLCV